MRYIFLFWFACQSVISYGQGLRNIIVNDADNGKIFSDFLIGIEKKYDIDIVFDEKKIEAYTVIGISGQRRLVEYLEDYLIHHHVIRMSDDVLFIVEKVTDDELKPRKDDLIILHSSQQKTTSISGQVLDGGTDEPLIGAQVVVKGSDGTLTDVNGNFVLRVPEAIHRMEMKFVGFDTRTYIIGFSERGKVQSVKATLMPESRELESVIVTADRLDKNVSGELSGITKMDIKTIKSLPTFMGEVDPIKSLTTLPGVSTAGELASGFNVRGGEAGQNLILQDAAPIYNPSHLFGFFSAFNPDMVSDVVLYKGVPANLGGRISSVLDIQLKNGDAAKPSITGGVGLVSSRLTIEGPIVRDKSSFILGGRISYTDWLINSSSNVQLKSSSANFYDITGKLFHTINENNFITLSGYTSYDNFQLATDSLYSWGTMNVSLRWDHKFTDVWSSTLSIFNSNYFSEIQSFDELDPFVYNNKINTTGFKYDLRYASEEKLKFSAGIESNLVRIEPGKLVPSGDSGSVPFDDMNDQHALESALYFQSDYAITEKLGFSGGLRYSAFVRMGPDEIYSFDYSNISGHYPAITDTTSYKSGEIIKMFSGLEPRLSIRYLLPWNSSIKAGYFRGYQYLHLISNTTSATPQDYWVASGPYLKPEIGDQFSLGFFKNINNNKYEISAEGFYKDIYNAVDYIEGADITLNPSLEAGLVQGKGRAYGLEFMLKKSSGRVLNGWVSYTYSRSLRSFNSPSEYKLINEGSYYPSSFDKPHNLSVILNIKLGELTTLSANYNYSTGRPITIPVSKFSYEAYLSVLNYSQRNEYRIPDYHRLDLSVTFKDRPRTNKRFSGEWVFSVYNVYGRENAYSIFFSRYGTAKKLSILGTVFPSFTYNFKFQ